MNGQNIPQTMKAQAKWVCWKYGERDGKQTKFPVNPNTGGNAMSNEPGTWGTYYKAIAAKSRLNMDGIGFMFGDGFVGIDIDHCVNTETGEISEVASKIVAALDSYTEFSPSGTGLHIIVKGSLPAEGRKNTELGLEMYSEGRYFTMTGNRTHGSDVEERTDQLSAVHAEYLKKDKPQQERRQAATTGGLVDDDELLQKAFRSKGGAQIEQLFNGQWQGLFPSQSEADMSLCNTLAFWCNGDTGQMDRLFRRSGLMREKWDELRNGQPYGQRTITIAVEDMRDGYTTRRRDDDWMPGPNEDPTEAAEEGQAEDALPALPVMFSHEAIPADAAYHNGLKQYEPDDTGNAARFRDLYGDNAKYSFNNKSWYIWNGKLWQEDINGSIKRMAEQAIYMMQMERVDLDPFVLKTLDKQIRRVRSSPGKEAMIKETQHLSPITPEQMDADDNLLNLLNGIYDLEAGELLPHARDKYMTRICQVSYDADAPKPEKWLAFLDEVMAGDTDLTRFLQKAVGYSLSGYAVEQCFFVLYGTGANGKGTFIDALREMMGGYLMNAQAESVMVRDRGSGSSASGDIARLKSARMVTCSETEEGKKLSEALIKQLTGGDAITCRFLFSKEFEYVPKFKIYLQTNHKPIIKGTEEGVWRRIHMIPFNVTITKDKRDPHLGEKLKAELPGILLWALEGYRLWKAEGLTPPKAVREATAEYRTEMDIIKAFLEECTQRENVDLRLASSDIYNVYRRWSELNGEKPMTTTKFGMKLVEHGAEKQRTLHGIEYKYISLTKAGKDLQNQGNRRGFIEDGYAREKNGCAEQRG